MSSSLPILNLEEARYECTYGRGCDGVCCREGRPLVYPEEIDRIDANLDRFMTLLRPAAQNAIRRKGYVGKRRRIGQRIMRNADGWCVFFHNGCVFHQVGAAEGDKYRYKPAVCSLFPIQADGDGNWYVRQKGYKKEKWDLFCLDPENSPRPAAETLQSELALAQRFEDEYQAAAVREALATKEAGPP
jgi:hypothetical protein